MERRNFLKSSAATLPGLLLPLNQINMLAPFKTDLEVLVMNTNWGYRGSLDDFCKESKAAGYDGIEVWWSKDPKHRKDLFQTLDKYELAVGFLVAGSESDPKAHFQSFKQSLDEACSLATNPPVYINCHSGKDFFTFDENCRIIEYSLEQAAKSGLKVLHETHRGRMCFAAHITKGFIDKFPEMQLTLDISHWVNVHESLLNGLEETVASCLERVAHIHARIGHPEGPQVNDFRAPEWEKVLNQHLNWWDQALKDRQEAGDTQISFLTEFGPPNYLPTLPYTQQPVADQWGINVAMKDLLQSRYS